jgi:hypothetical protein
MDTDPLECLTWARTLGPSYERGALDCSDGALERTAAFLKQRRWPAGASIYPWGLDSGRLWEPWRAARDTVESLPEDPQEPGAQADYLLYDREAASITLGKIGAWKPGCARLYARECPRMIPMGHESPHADCNYWAWPGMVQAAPDLEFFPEWQRFDCSRYYPLFQLHLCGEALALILGAQPRWVFHAPPEAGPALRAYAALSSRPGAFELGPLS